MKTVEEIITDEEINRIHANANFGSDTKRQVVNETIIAYAFGFSSGHTAFQIAREHGLLTKPKGRNYSSDLTAKGKLYLQSLVKNKMERIYTLCNEEMK